MAIRVLIADDEPSARTTLRLLLAQDPDVQLIGECRSGRETVDSVLRLRPDILFLDIQMPGGTGFEAHAELPPDAVPVIVFVTAYDRYSLQAFEIHAADYLLKPFSDRRFQAALAWAKERHGQRATGIGQRAAGSGQPAAGGGQQDRIAVRSSHGVLMLALADIDWIEARGDYVRIHGAGRADLVRESLTSLESRLDASRFIRVHRSAIVNLSRVREFRQEPGSAMVAVLLSGQRCRLSRQGRERLGRVLAVPV